MTKLSRKYDRLTKYLNSVIGNERMKDSVRMEAVRTLDSIYNRHEAAAEKAAARAERMEARKLGYTVAPPIEKADVRSTGAVPKEAPSPEELKANLERAEIDKLLGRA